MAQSVVDGSVTKEGLSPSLIKHMILAQLFISFLSLGSGCKPQEEESHECDTKFSSSQVEHDLKTNRANRSEQLSIICPITALTCIPSSPIVQGKKIRIWLPAIRIPHKTFTLEALSLGA